MLLLQVPDEDLVYYSKFDETLHCETELLAAPKTKSCKSCHDSNIDRSVGAIIDRLEKLGISDNTLIIFSSDNGPTPEGGGDIEFSTQIASTAATSAICMRVVSECPLWHVGLAEFNQESQRPRVRILGPYAYTGRSRRHIPPNNDGLSFLPALLQAEGQEQHQSLYWEFHNTRGRPRASSQIFG